MKNIKNSKKGFTLIELIAVIAIMMIFLAVAMPFTVKYIDDASENADKNYTEDIMSVARQAALDLSDKAVVVTSKSLLKQMGENTDLSVYPYPIYYRKTKDTTVDQLLTDNGVTDGVPASMFVVYADQSGNLVIYFFVDGVEQEDKRCTAFMPI